MNDLILYVLVRTDMESMKYGKGAAQTGHACNKFTRYWIINPLMQGMQPCEDAWAWNEQADGFGTTFTLAVPSLRAMIDAVEAAEVLGFKAGPVTDPTYPFLVPNEMVGRLDQTKLTAPTLPGRNGKSLCFTEETTTAYVFGNKADLEVLLARFEPLPNE
jgi:hypothetical protein